MVIHLGGMRAEMFCAAICASGEVELIAQTKSYLNYNVLSLFKSYTETSFCTVLRLDSF